MAIEKPADLSRAATAVLTLCRAQDNLKGLDHAELATTLRAAADVCTQLMAHNVSMVHIANLLKGGPE